MPGSGKTREMIKEIATHKGRYLFATSRIELIEERIQDLRRQAVAAGTNPTVHAIHGRTERGRGPVLAEIEDAVSLHQHEEHALVSITHEGMMGANLDGFAGWHIYIDENPAAVCSDVFQVPAAATYLGWERITSRPVSFE